MLKTVPHDRTRFGDELRRMSVKFAKLRVGVRGPVEALTFAARPMA